eukprot:gnl/Chilomastix_caulleri/972.p1 GENE.gnl/Chilomastix_caulleri/972~~gnl/Chilomastix_caulleri/972.p1  ORF type:complete len:129 (+),score=15.97 gnl/Chilomastix_caulleri/972:54-440(+)
MAFKYCGKCSVLVGYEPNLKRKELQLRCSHCGNVESTIDNLVFDVTKSVSVAESIDDTSATGSVKLTKVQIKSIMNDPVLKRRRLEDSCIQCGKHIFILYQISTDKGLTEMNFVDICSYCGSIRGIKD